MTSLEKDKFSLAKEILTHIEEITDPSQRIQEFENGIDLLTAYVRENQPLEEKREWEIKELRSACFKKLLGSLTQVRGNSSQAWMEHVSILLGKMKTEFKTVLHRYSQNTLLFPQPLEGAISHISPPAFTWKPMAGASNYRIEIKDVHEQVVYEKVTGTDPVHLPDRIFPSGRYSWDLIALDPEGREQTRKSTCTFTIANKVPSLPWIDPATLLAMVPKQHSRFLYARSDLPSIRASLFSTRQRAWKNCLEAAESAMKGPIPVYPKYHLHRNTEQAKLEYHQYVRQFNRVIDKALMDLSLAFLITEEEKYAIPAKRILLEVASWSTNENDVTSLSSRWGDEPGLSLARCGHRAYDWLFESLSPQERSQVLTMCEARAWQTYRRLVRCNYLACPGESHNGRLIAYLAEMAIVMTGEIEGPRTWLTYSLKALTTFFPHWGGMEGGWAEGTTYGQTYNLKYIPAIETLRTNTGFDLWKRPFFKKTRYFFFYCTAIRGEISPFGDNSDTGGANSFRKKGFAALLWHHGHRFHDPYIGWWINQIEDWPGPTGELSLLFEDKLDVKPPIDLPQSRVFHDIGWAALHSDLSQPDQDTFLLFKSSPFGSASHSHADQNTFCIFKGGRALAIPSGYYGPANGMPHHAQWTRSTKANNCILINGKGQPTQTRKASGYIKAFDYRQDYTYVAGDATAAYMGQLTRCTRHIFFVPPGLILLLDELEAPDPATFQWLLHAFEEFEIEDVAGRILSRRNGASLEIFIRSPCELKYHQTDRFDPPYNEGVPIHLQRDVPNQWHLTVETKEKQQTLRIGAIMGVQGPGEFLKLEVLQDSDGWFGAQLRGEFGRVEGWIQLQHSAVVPKNYRDNNHEGSTIFCGTAASGKTFIQNA